MKIINVSKPVIGPAEKKAVMKTMESGMLVQGEKVAEFEKLFAKLCGTKYAVAVNSGTAALHTALYALGIKPGDEVITTPFTFVATANAVLMVGAKPVFVDIQSDTFNIDPIKIKEAITKKTRAIIAVDLFGQPADFEEINRIAAKHKLFVVEDAAQSINAKYQGKRTGNLADIGCFSLYATKNIMCGEGGIITTNCKTHYKRCLLFRNHGQLPDRKYSYSDLGYNYRMTDLEAVICIEQLKKLDKITKKRQKIAQKYNNSFLNMKNLTIPDLRNKRTHAYHQYTLRVKGNKGLRDKFRKYLLKNRVQSNVFYPYPLYKFNHLSTGARCPVAEKATTEVLSIPIHPSLSKAETDYIIRIINQYEN